MVIPEFIGRLPVVFTLKPLTKEMLVAILKEPKNAILKQYQKLLALDEVDLQFEDGALEAIAEKAMEKDTGARALRAIIEKFMLDIMYEIISETTDCRSLRCGSTCSCSRKKNEAAADGSKVVFFRRK